MGRYKSLLMAEKDARDFPFHVDVEVPPMGLGRQMNIMSAWITGNLGGEWRSHGLRAGGRDVSRYMFRTRAEAAAFAAALGAGMFARQS